MTDSSEKDQATSAGVTVEVKGADLSGYSQQDLNAVALQLNTRPRTTLGFTTPAAKLAETVAMTA